MDSVHHALAHCHMDSVCHGFFNPNIHRHRHRHVHTYFYADCYANAHRDEHSSITVDPLA
jgi:hypothetical protein